MTAFAPDVTTGENRGSFAVTFTGSVKDRNTERQISNISVLSEGAGILGADHVVTQEEMRAASEPEAYGTDGFKVWTGTANDGVLNFRYRQPFAALSTAGVYVFNVRVSDVAGTSATWGTPASITITSFSDITLSTDPVTAEGIQVPGANWGEWDAEAGDTNVESTNYLKLARASGPAHSPRIAARPHGRGELLA